MNTPSSGLIIVSLPEACADLLPPWRLVSQRAGYKTWAKDAPPSHTFSLTLSADSPFENALPVSQATDEGFIVIKP